MLISSFSLGFNQKHICLVSRQPDMCKWIIFNDQHGSGYFFDPSLCLFRLIVEVFSFQGIFFLGEWSHSNECIFRFGLFSSFSPYFNQKQICMVPRQKDMCKWIIFNDSKNRPIWIGSIFDPSFCLLVRFRGGIFCFREYFLWSFFR